MSEHDDLLHNMFTAAAADLRPLLTRRGEDDEPRPCGPPA
jgi:hypothetical protein